ncbi:uncharacterized protein LOC128920332 [Zeugodacus cucurbitae]|uniref:uncharacterized protein LOC128920332 n=1 Tax=Zeugodacus cucurbitae TaxID=28588 RepID=UPI0023D9394C|nr:uncharacterized protein LOC128920332 [Zeugodacus cucurbitae]
MLTTLQEVIMDEVPKDWKHSLTFSGIFFRSGLLLIDCIDEQTASWLSETAPRLQGWTGPSLCTRRGDDIPSTYNMTVFLPRCAGKTSEYVFGLQNEGLSTSAWRVISDKDEEGGLRLNIGIDLIDQSYALIRKKGYRLYFRYSTIVIRPWNKKGTESKDDKTKTVAEVSAPPVSSSSLDCAAPGNPEEQSEGSDQNALPTTQELLDGLAPEAMQVDKNCEETEGKQINETCVEKEPLLEEPVL